MATGQAACIGPRIRPEPFAHPAIFTSAGVAFSPPGPRSGSQSGLLASARWQPASLKAICLCTVSRSSRGRPLPGKANCP